MFIEMYIMMDGNRENYSTNDLFIKLKILTLEQLYDKLSITKVFYYINRGIKLFNQLHANI